MLDPYSRAFGPSSSQPDIAVNKENENLLLKCYRESWSTLVRKLCQVDLESDSASPSKDVSRVMKWMRSPDVYNHLRMQNGIRTEGTLQEQCKVHLYWISPFSPAVCHDALYVKDSQVHRW